LSNLLSKQSHQYGHLLAPQKMKFDLTDYSVDVRVLDQAITQESSKESFQKFQADVKKLGKQIGSYINEVRGGRSTSSDVIFPSTGSSGNITGRTFPNNTWSLTF